jgi:hypothetical protein
MSRYIHVAKYNCRSIIYVLILLLLKFNLERYILIFQIFLGLI